MFDQSRRLQVAIEAVLYIALNSAAGPVQSRDITDRQGIAPRYLEPILQRLGRANIVLGVRGPRGGYRLARERRRITIGDIVRTVMESGDGEPLKGPTTDLARQVIGPYWTKCEEQFLARLDETTIEMLCRRAHEEGLFRPPPQPADYTI